MTNNANIPFPVGPKPDKYTSQIMKIVIQGTLKPTDQVIFGGVVANPLPSNFFSTTRPNPYATAPPNPYATAPPNPYATAPANPYTNAFSTSPTTSTGSVILGGSFRDTIVNEVTSRLNTLSSSFFSPTDYINNPNTKIWPFVGSNSASSSSSLSTPLPSDFIIKNTNYPRFPEGIPYFTVLTDLQNSKGELTAITIDAVSMDLGRNCEGATFKIGETYDFYIINLTED